MNIERIKEIFQTKLFKTIRLSVALTLVMLVVASAATAHYINLTEVEIEFDRLPHSFDGYKIGVIADLHLGLYTKEKQIEKMFTILDEQQPDIVVIVGDHIYSAPGAFHHYNPKNAEIIKSVFRRISSKYPTYAVNGNHDNEENKDAIISATIESGVVFMDNHHEWIANASNTNDRILLSGVADLDTDTIDFASAVGVATINDFSIMLSHNPKAVNMITNSNYGKYVDLMIAGHTHAGQINLGSVMDFMFEPAHKYGLRKYGNVELYVTSGIGLSLLPIRFNAPAEVAVITIRSTQSPQSPQTANEISSENQGESQSEIQS